MRVMLSKQSAGKVGSYILRSGTIGIDNTSRIGEYWMMSLSNVDRQARLDISLIILENTGDADDFDADR